MGAGESNGSLPTLVDDKGSFYRAWLREPQSVKVGGSFYSFRQRKLPRAAMGKVEFCFPWKLLPKGEYPGFFAGQVNPHGSGRVGSGRVRPAKMFRRVGLFRPDPTRPATS